MMSVIVVVDSVIFFNFRKESNGFLLQVATYCI